MAARATLRRRGCPDLHPAAALPEERVANGIRRGSAHPHHLPTVVDAVGLAVQSSGQHPQVLHSAAALPEESTVRADTDNLPVVVDAVRLTRRPAQQRSQVGHGVVTLGARPVRQDDQQRQSGQTATRHFHSSASLSSTGEKGGRHHLPERPGGCFAQMVPVPFSLPQFRRRATASRPMAPTASRIRHDGSGTAAMPVPEVSP